MTATYKEALGRDIDTPTKQRFSHDDFEFQQVRDKEAKVLRNKNQTPYHKAHSRGKLTDKQLDAAEWFEKAWGIVYGGLVPKTRDTLDITPRGAPASPDATPNFINIQDILKKVEARIKLETQEEYKERNRKVRPSSRSLIPLLEVGKEGAKRYEIIQSVCGQLDVIGECRPSYKKYRLLCEGLDIVHEVAINA